MDGAVSRAQTGQTGEQAVADDYAARGYVIEARNWSCPVGELDVVARRGDLLAIIEVRTVRSRFLTTPTLTVSAAKQRKVAAAADRYLRTRADPVARVRFDVVGVFLGERGAELSVIEDAFAAPWAF